MEPSANDAELVRQTVRGVTEAFHQLTARYYRPVASFILKRVSRPPDLVEDLVQETFLEAFQALKAGKEPQHFSSWLFGIAHNRCGKWLRRKRPVLFDPQAAPELAAPSEQALREEREEQEQQMNRLHTQLRGLPEETRRLLQMKHRDGKTCAQIAAETGRPVGTVKSLLARTYKWLRTALAPASGDTNR